MSSEEETRRQATRYFHDQIPITREMGVVVESWHDGVLVLSAPLAPNHNHLGTAFGGSLVAIATLAGYGLLWLWLDDPALHIVVRSSRVEYLRPVRGTIRATCKLPGDAALDAFKSRLTLKGKARLALHVVIEEDGETCVELDGIFVAVR